jgi:23S rRNA (adenine2503-C2)-methyltransferase
MLPSLAGLLPKEIEKLLSPLPGFRAKQIYKWIIRGVTDFDQMTDLPLSLQKELKERFTIFAGGVTERHDDEDAKKIAVTLKDGLKIEAVLLNDGKNRYTACLSTQAGCPVKCVFCKTGTLGFSRNLDSAEIIEQFLFLQNIVSSIKNAENKERHLIDNIVIMGMGEPLLNLGQLRKALSFFTDKKGINFSKRRITVSTCGIIDGLRDLAENGPYVRLALSLTTADEVLRQRLMPGTVSNPLEKVREALIVYQKKSSGRLTLEIPLLGGINTRDTDAFSIAEFSKGMDVVINIIPWNPVSGLEFEGRPLREPQEKETENFIKKLEGYGLKVTMRRRKGRGVLGACGQLGSLSQQNTK